MNPLIELNKYGQSVWLDNISRGILKNNELKNLIEHDGLKGVTSNPTIFQKAIGSGSDYDSQLKELLENSPDLNTRELFEKIAVKDIQDAADLLINVYNESGGTDGYVSIEVSPDFAYNTEATIEEASRLASGTGRPNIMIKIPATPEGIPAIREMISRGVNINVTLIFSPRAYENVVEAYISGLEDRISKGLPINNIASVASFFISRIDTLVDKELDLSGKKEFKGKTAIANAKLVYRRAKELFSSQRFKKLEEKGAKIQRLLWASTSTKNPDYPDTIYIDGLIGKNTVNTMPPATIISFRDHGKLSNAIETDVDEAQTHMEKLASFGIDFGKVTDKLLKDGVESFAASFRDLLKTIDEKKNNILENLVSDIKLTLPPAVNHNYKKRLEMWGKEKTASRLWERDFSLWKEKKEDDRELSNRLGWLEMPYLMQNAVKPLKEFADEVKKDFTDIVLLGMGGSSLAPAVFYKTFGRKKGYPSLTVLDSTHPEAVKKNIIDKISEKTLFIVSSKSGTTVETSSFMHTAFEAMKKIRKIPGENFVAITDPGTVLETFAVKNNFRKIFLTPSEVGGRYSALTYFGLVPAVLTGVDIEIILNRAFHFMNESKDEKGAELSGGFKLGAALGELELKGRDKLVIVASQGISSFPSWIEQLIAESTGKEGKGILPVIEEEILHPDHYKNDAALVYLRLRKDNNKINDEKIEDIQASGLPLIHINLEDEYDLGREFYRWEIATALAGSVLKINPFDQPNVQLAKTLASEAVNSFKKEGKLAVDPPSFEEKNISVYAGSQSENIRSLLKDFLIDLAEDSYISVMAFVNPDDETDAELSRLKKNLKEKYNTTVTTGYGPGFLHSTGQLHKGDANKGLFIQLTSSCKNDIDVPGEGFSFGVLITSQARGDFKALKNLGRKVIRFHFNENTAEGIRYLIKMLE